MDLWLPKECVCNAQVTADHSMRMAVSAYTLTCSESNGTLLHVTVNLMQACKTTPASALAWAVKRKSMHAEAFSAYALLPVMC